MRSLEGTITLKFNSSWGVLESNPGNELSDLRVQQIPRIEYIDGDFQPVMKHWIPGSTLKGSLRITALRLDPESCGKVHTNDKVQTCSRKNRCRVCNLFGNFNREGKVKISSSFIERANPVLQPHVSVSRDKKAASSGGLFHIERLTSSEAHADILARDLTEDEEKLLRVSLELWGNMGLGSGHVPFEVTTDIHEIVKGGYFA